MQPTGLDAELLSLFSILLKQTITEGCNLLLRLLLVSEQVRRLYQAKSMEIYIHAYVCIVYIVHRAAL